MRENIKYFFSVNWIKTLYFNFTMFPLSVASKLPVYFYGNVAFRSLKGKITITAPIKRAMIGFGQSYEVFKSSKGTAELHLDGQITFNGYTQFGKDYLVYVSENAKLEFGNMSSLGSNGKILCYHKITLGDYARIGFESQLMDTTAHQMINTINQEKFPMFSPIIIGNFNYISNRVTVLAKTKTPDYCSIASNSLCLKDYTSLGKNILLGGIPANLIKENISRDWANEMVNMKKWLNIN